MEKSKNFFQPIIHYLLLIIIFLLPLFFLPFTQDFYLTNKLYLLIFGSLFLLLISTIQYLISKKISWSSLSFDTPLAFFLITLGLSIIFSSPNKIQALLNPNFGLSLFLSLTILYFYLSRQKSLFIIHYSLLISSLILSLTTVFFFFQPLKNVNLPANLQFLKNPYFTPIGSFIDLAIFLGFVVVYLLGKIIIVEKDKVSKNSIIHYSSLTINLLALSLTLYSLFKPGSTILPPFRLSWYAAVEVLKNPLTAFFGVGIDNFSSIFTKVKDIAYNQSNLWQIPSFSFSRSSLLHLFTETGLFGLIAFLILILTIFKSLKEKNDKSLLLIIIYSLFIIVFFPPSLIVFFLFFLIIFMASQQSTSDLVGQSYDFSQIMPFYALTGIVFLLIIVIAGYFSGRSYLAEIYFKKSLDGLINNNLKQVYDNNRQAIIINPYIERYRVNFSQINLLVANNIAAKANQPQEKNKQPYQLTETDRQNISQAIQAAINEAKAAISLNPQKASYWENLAVIYQNIINTAQGADVWTISAYQRAIVSDPQNPGYRLSLGGIYYSLGNYEEAVKVFEQVVVLKPDWANAYYNLAWADYQKGNYQKAYAEMKNVLTLLNPEKDKNDYEKAKKELEEFKKKLPEEKKTSSETKTETGSTQLNLPSPVPTIFEEKIKLPKEASPEAK
ncbi:MAG: tetratricopeptide repeat protein [Patescibacteria group bacterium]|nr:tetratricopeptide repeat protein [Patescibacteria group bacterium]